MEELDQADWQRYCRGDNTAFTRIYDRHKNHLMTYLIHVGHSREVGEDVVQEVFLSLSRQKAINRRLESVRNWLFICARNLSVNQMKRRRRETTLVTESLPAPPAPTQDVDLRGILARLESDERELILLREYHGFSTGELSEMFNVTEEAIRVRLYRVRERLCEIGKGSR